MHPIDHGTAPNCPYKLQFGPSAEVAERLIAAVEPTCLALADLQFLALPFANGLSAPQCNPFPDAD